MQILYVSWEMADGGERRAYVWLPAHAHALATMRDGTGLGPAALRYEYVLLDYRPGERGLMPHHDAPERARDLPTWSEIVSLLNAWVLDTVGIAAHEVWDGDDTTLHLLAELKTVALVEYRTESPERRARREALTRRYAKMREDKEEARAATLEARSRQGEDW